MDIDVIVERKSFDVELEVGNPVVEVKAPDHYNGPFDIFPSDEDQIIPVKEKMPVEDICVKGITGEKTITQNGTYNVLTDKTVAVDVNPDLRPLSVSENGSYQPDGFDGYSGVTVDVPQQFTLDNLVNSAALKNLGEITVNVSDIGDTAFNGWTFDTIHLPNVEKFPSYYPFSGTGIKYIDMPNVWSLGRTFYECWSFRGTYGDGEGVLKLKKVTKISGSCFYSCSRLKRVYFYKTATIASNAFGGCSGITDIYVPWSEGEVADAPWEATNATIHYDTVYDEDGNVVSST